MTVISSHLSRAGVLGQRCGAILRAVTPYPHVNDTSSMRLFQNCLIASSWLFCACRCASHVLLGLCVAQRWCRGGGGGWRWRDDGRKRKSEMRVRTGMLTVDT